MSTCICVCMESSFRITACALFLCIPCGCVTYIDYVTEIAVTGKVQNKETGAAISGVTIDIGRDIVLGPDELKRLGFSNESGYITGQHEIKWGWGRTSIGFWREKKPRLTLEIRLYKDGYVTEEFVKELPDLNNVIIDLGTIELKEID